MTFFTSVLLGVVKKGIYTGETIILSGLTSKTRGGTWYYTLISLTFTGYAFLTTLFTLEFVLSFYFVITICTLNIFNTLLGIIGFTGWRITILT